MRQGDTVSRIYRRAVVLAYTAAAAAAAAPGEDKRNQWVNGASTCFFSFFSLKIFFAFLRARLFFLVTQLDPGKMEMTAAIQGGFPFSYF